MTKSIRKKHRRLKRQMSPSDPHVQSSGYERRCALERARIRADHDLAGFDEAEEIFNELRAAEKKV